MAYCRGTVFRVGKVNQGRRELFLRFLLLLVAVHVAVSLLEDMSLSRVLAYTVVLQYSTPPIGLCDGSVYST